MGIAALLASNHSTSRCSPVAVDNDGLGSVLPAVHWAAFKPQKPHAFGEHTFQHERLEG